MVCKEQSGLACRVPRTDEMDVCTMRGARLAARRSVIDTLADQPIDPVDFETTPRDPRRENDRSGADDVVAIEQDPPGLRIDPLDRTRNDRFRPQSFRLLERADRELLAGDSIRKSKIVFDPR